MSVVNDMTTPNDPRSSIGTRKPANTAASLGMLGLLTVQFLIGMAVNLYVTLPSANSGMAGMMRGGPLVMIHMMLGIILVVGATVAFAIALPYGRWAVTCAAISLVGMLVAGVGGITFLMGSQSNGASFLMAIGFLVAVGGYVADLVKVT